MEHEATRNWTVNCQTQLTLDIWELITDILGDDQSCSHYHLRRLSLTCKAMVPLSRKYLFATIVIGHNLKRCARFHVLLSHNPSISRYVRYLHYNRVKTDDIHAQHIFQVMKSHSKVLQSINCRLSGNSTSWGSLPNSLQVALVALIHLPSITKLCVLNIKSLPSSVLSRCTALKHLTLEEVTLIETDDIQIVDRTPRPQYLCASHGSFNGINQFLGQERRAHGRQRGVDFRDLEEMRICIWEAKDLEEAWQVLQISPSVQFVFISILGPLPWAGLGAAISGSILPKLTKLRIQTEVTSDDYDPLCDLVSELRVIAGENILEHFILVVELQTDVICADTEDWSMFDSLITNTKFFPMLKVVRVEIRWIVCERDESEFENRITHEDFPELYQSRTLDFQFFNEFI